MADDEEGKRLLRLAKMADVETENPDEAEIPWAAGINPFKKDEDDMGMTPEEFLKLTDEGKDLPEFAMIDVSGGKYLDGSLKVKVPDEGPKGYKIVPMNKYTDPLNLHPSNRGGKHKVYPMWEQMADDSTSPGDPKSVVAVGYGADVRGGASQMFNKRISELTPKEINQAEQAFTAKWSGLQMRGKKRYIDQKVIDDFEQANKENRAYQEALYEKYQKTRNEKEYDAGIAAANESLKNNPAVKKYRELEELGITYGSANRPYINITTPGKRPIPKSAPQREVPPMKDRSKDLDRVLLRMKK